MAAGKRDDAPMNDLALDVVVARKYADVLYTALCNMRAVTSRHGAPTADELIGAIDHALDKANSESIEIGLALLSDRKPRDSIV